MSNCKEIVFESIRNKHNISKDTISILYSEVQKTSFNSLTLKSLKEIVYSDYKKYISINKESKPIEDIFFQITLCSLIVNHAHRLMVSIDLIEDIHRFLLNTQDTLWRTTEIVDDFNGKIPTELSEVKELFSNFSKKFVVISQQQKPSNKTKADNLALIYSSMIRIHPFADGNGRVARYLCIFLLSLWKNEIMIIPKVRNDKDWKTSLEKAIYGDPKLLSNWFEKRLKNKATHV